MKELNLIPYEMKEEKLKRSKFQSYIIYLLLIIIILTSGVIISNMNLSNLKQQEALLKKQVQKSQFSISESESIQKELSNFKDYTDKINFLTKNKVSSRDRIAELEQNVPKDVVFTELKYTEAGIEVNATASYYNSICEMAAQLESSKNYNKSEINKISYDNTKSLYTFSIKLEY